MTAQSYTTSTIIKARLGISDSTDDTVLGVIAGQVNAWLEGRIGFPVGPIASVERTFDGDRVRWRDGVPYLNCYPFGVRAVTVAKTASETGGSYTTQTLSDVLVRPHSFERQTDWPGFELWVKDTATWTWTTYGYDVNAVTATWGWEAVPEELASIATRVAIAAFKGRGHGTGSEYMVADDVQAIATDELSASDWKTIGMFAALKGYA